MTEKIEIEVTEAATAKDVTAVYVNGKEKIKGTHTAKTDPVKGNLNLTDLTKGISAVTVAEADKDKTAEKSKRPSIKKDGKVATAGDSTLKAFGDKIKTLTTKIKS